MQRNSSRNRFRYKSNAKREARGLDYQSLEPRQLLAPLAGNDTFAAIGNTVHELNVGGAFGDRPSVKVTGSVLDNDQDFTSIIDFESAGNNGGSLTLEADGSFVFIPPVGQTDLTTSFSYTISDGVDTDVGQISFEIAGIVWYADQAFVGGLGSDGSSHEPFADASSLISLGGVDQPGSTIYLSGSTPFDLGAADFQLEDSQLLAGSGDSLIGRGGVVLAEATETVPVILSNDTAITVTGLTASVRGVEIQGKIGINVVATESSLFLHNMKIASAENGIVANDPVQFSLSMSDSQFKNIEFVGVHVVNGQDVAFQISNNEFTNVERVFDAEFETSGFMEFGTNIFSQATTGIRLTGAQEYVQINGNQFNNVAAPIYVSQLGTPINERGDLSVRYNVFAEVDSYVDHPYAISVEGVFGLDDLNGNWFSSSYVLALQAIGDFDLDFGGLHLNSGVEFQGNGNINLDGLTATTASFQGVDVTIGEVSLYNGFGSTLLGSSPVLRAVDSTVSIETGWLRGAGTLLEFDNVNMDIVFDGLTDVEHLTGNDRDTHLLKINNSSGNFTVNGPIFTGNQIQITSDETSESSADFVFNGPVRVDQSSSPTANTGIFIETNADNDTVTFNDTVYVSISHDGIDIDRGTVNFEDNVYLERYAGYTSPGSGLALEVNSPSLDTIETFVAFNGGLSVQSSDSGIRAHAASLSITGDENRIFVTGRNALSLALVDIPQAGIKFDYLFHNSSQETTGGTTLTTRLGSVGPVEIGTLSLVSLNGTRSFSATGGDSQIPFSIGNLVAYQYETTFWKTDLKVTWGTYDNSSLFLRDSNLEFDLSSFSSSINPQENDESLLSFWQTTGFFTLHGTGSQAQGGDGSGGVIYNIQSDDDSPRELISVREAENVTLRNLYILNNNVDALSVNNAHNFALLNSTIYQSESERFSRSVSVNSPTGYFLVDGSLFSELDTALHINVGFDAVQGNIRISNSAFVQSPVTVSSSDSSIAVTIVNNQFSSSELEIGHSVFDGARTANINVADNSFLDFGLRGLKVDTGEGDVTVNITRNQFTGRENSSSGPAIEFRAFSSTLNLEITDHQGENRMTRTGGIQLSINSGINDSESTILIDNNELDIVTGEQGVGIFGHSNGSATVSNNRITTDSVARQTGIFVSNGSGNSTGQTLRLNMLDNVIAFGALQGETTGIRLEQAGGSVFHLVAPATSPLIGSTFVDEDGGLLLLLDETGNRNQVIDANTDVLVNGTISIVE